MRIVGGSLSGRVLRAPSGMATRPTSERVREALFQILGDVTGAHVLDLFAGSGAVGIEAISRGAAHVTFVETHRVALATIRKNLAELSLDDRAQVIAGHAASVVKRAPPEPWQLVFVDPPYASDLAITSVRALPAEHLAPAAVVVIEHDRHNRPPDVIGSLVRKDERRYGDTYLSFYEAA